MALISPSIFPLTSSSLAFMLAAARTILDFLPCSTPAFLVELESFFPVAVCLPEEDDVAFFCRVLGDLVMGGLI